MSVKVMASVWEHSRQEGTALLMLLAIADNANEYGEAWPSIGSLAQKCRLKERQAQKLIKKLEADNELIVGRQRGHVTPTGRTNLYTVITPGALPRTGVSYSTPLDEGVHSSTPVGVHSRVARGVLQGSQGVSYSAPKPSVNHQEPTRALGDKKNEIVAALKDLGLTRGQAINFATTRPGLDIAAIARWQRFLKSRNLGVAFMVKALSGGDTEPPDSLTKDSSTGPPVKQIADDPEALADYLKKFDEPVSPARYR